MAERKPTEFERVGGEQNRAGILRELWGFMKENKKWWLLPLLAAFVVLGLLIFLSSTGLAPFIYTLF